MDFLEIATELIRDKKKHEHYDRVVAYSDMMSKYVTGHKLEEELRRFVPRETEEMFKQRLALTQLIAPSICASLIKPHYRMARVNPVVRKIDLEDGKEADERIDKIEESIAKYYGELSLDGYMENVWITIKETDPNAFFAITFDSFDSAKEKAKPYPIVISCKEAWNYEIKNGELIWLLAAYEETHLQSYKTVYETKQRKQQGLRFRFYTKDTVWEFYRVDNLGMSFQDGLVEYEGSNYYKINGEVYKIEEYLPKAGEITAQRIGVTLDPITDFKTCISTIDKALPYLKRSVHAVSEMDISRALHVFLQKIQYAPACTGESTIISCNDGKTPDGHTCRVCNGSGKQIVTSGQDSIVLSLPRDPKDAFMLDNLVRYVDVPIDILRFLQELIEKTEAKAIKAVYGSEVYQTDTTVTTATEKLVDMQDVYDTMYLPAQKYSNLWEWQVRTTAAILDFENVIVKHQSAKDFGMKSMSNMVMELQTLNASNAPSYLKEEISQEIAKIIYIDRPQELKKISIKKMFSPFYGMSIEEINLAVSNGGVTQNSLVLWAENNMIFNSLELEQAEANKYLYDLPIKTITELVEGKIEELILELEPEPVEPTDDTTHAIPPQE